MKYLYRIYQLCIALPIIFVYTIFTALIVVIGCTLGNGHFWGYYPGKWWAWLIIRVLLLPVKVEGRENIKPGQSYVFVSNHQGAFDIFLIYGFLCRNFKWMMKRQLRKVPFVGIACQYSHQIFVDKRGPRKIKETYDKARATLRDGMSLVVFPEGSRTFTGHMGVFKRGAFMLADELQLSVVPLTINGSFNIKPRTRDMNWVTWHPLRLTIHKPIDPIGQGAENVKNIETESYRVIMADLVPEYQGYTENPDQK
jgi:1-acyl-sn-glycerol-3-phosphate acyltransferase